MVKLTIVSMVVLTLAVVMTMAGRGGGNFYVVVLVLSGIPMHEAATTGQFILFMTAISALFVFQKNKLVTWPFAIFFGILMASSALAGGYFSHWLSGFSLKVVFSCLLAVAGGLMLLPLVQPVRRNAAKQWRRQFAFGGNRYLVNPWLAIIVTLSAGFGSGMVGVSGGSFLVPLMVLACGIPMHIAVATASTLIASTALMGFVGHALRGDCDPVWAIPLAGVAVIGGFVGAQFTLKTKPEKLKQLFAYTTLIASLLMVINAICSR